MVQLSAITSASFTQSANGLVFVSTLLISQGLLFVYFFHRMWKKSAEYEARMLADADFYTDSAHGLPISQYPAVVSLRAREIHIDSYPVTVKSEQV